MAIATFITFAYKICLYKGIFCIGCNKKLNASNSNFSQISFKPRMFFFIIWCIKICTFLTIGFSFCKIFVHPNSQRYPSFIAISYTTYEDIPYVTKTTFLKSAKFHLTMAILIFLTK